MHKLLRLLILVTIVSSATALVVASASCSLAESGPDLIVADSTVFIVGTIEVSPDTVVHHPQVFVGRLVDPQDRQYDILQDPELRLGRELYTPDLWGQVMRKMGRFKLKAFPETRASVSVTGPLGTPAEATARFSHEGRGVYGDGARALPLEPGARYRLDVSLADGRHYTAETHTPRPYRIEVPDVVRQPTRYVYHGPGNWSELGETQQFPCTPDPDPGSPVTVWNVSRQRMLDAEVFLLDDWRQLWFADRGDHLRASSVFHVVTHDAYPDGMDCYASWGTDANTSRWDSSPLFLRVAQLSDDLADWYVAPPFEYTTRDRPDQSLWHDPWFTAVIRVGDDADRDRDASYLPSVSNLDAVGAGGTRTKATDAVGVFGGLTARYLTRTIEPIRSFDPDTLGWTYLPGYPNP